MQLLLIMNDSSPAEKDESKPLIQCRHRIRKQSAKVSTYIDASKVYCYQQPSICTTSCIDETIAAANSFGDTFNQTLSLKPDSPIVECNGNQRSTQLYPKLKARRGLYRRKRSPNSNGSRRKESWRSTSKNGFNRSDCTKDSSRYVRQQLYFGSGLNFRSGSYQYWQDVEKVWRCEEGDPRLRFERILRHSRRQARDQSMMDDLIDFIILIFKAIVSVFRCFVTRNNRVDVDNPKTSKPQK